MPRETFSGGNTGVFVTGNGVIVVDTKLGGWGQVILDQIKTVTDKPVTMIINTHTHGDHTGSNPMFPPTVDIVAHENTKAEHAKLMLPVQGRQRRVSAEADVYGQADDRQRRGSRRAVLLRPRPYERRHMDRVSVGAGDADGRHVCVEGCAGDRSQQRRQRA